MRTAQDDWWVIGSAAVALHGAAVEQVADVDVLLTPTDAVAVCRSLRLAPLQGRPDTRFRSAVFAQWTDPPLPVEFMAALEVRSAGQWPPVRPLTRTAIGDRLRSRSPVRNRNAA